MKKPVLVILWQLNVFCCMVLKRMQAKIRLRPLVMFVPTHLEVGMARCHRAVLEELGCWKQHTPLASVNAV